MPAQQRQHVTRVSIDHLDLHTRDAIARSLFDNLNILPLRLRLFTARRSTTALLHGKLSPLLNQGSAIIAFAISRQGRRRLRMPTVFELGHQVVRDLLLTLANRTPDTQTRIHIQSYAAPEAATLVGFGIAPFSPLLPT